MIMIRFRKRLLTAAAAVIISLSTALISYAAEGVIYFTDPETRTGEEVTVDMIVQADGSRLDDVKMILKYPAEALQFTEGTKASGGAGTIRVNGKGSAETEGKWIYSLKFRPVKAGEHIVSIDAETAEVYDSEGRKIDLTHLGTSKVTVEAGEGDSSGLLLESLAVSPGTLEPEFDSFIKEYKVTVGLSVKNLTISALPLDTSCEISVVNNEELKEGENTVSVFVKAKDSEEENEYRINVLKTEGGEESIVPSSEAETPAEFISGIPFSVKGKTITIMETDDDLSVPEGFIEGEVRIEGQPVKGWISENNSESPEYFLVYGMNDAGEINFYRYDLKERTLQRYFEDDIRKPMFTEEEYLTLQTDFDRMREELYHGQMLICILGVILFVAVCLIIYLIIRLSSLGKELYKEKNSKEEDPDRLPEEERSRRNRVRRRERREFYQESAALEDTAEEDDNENDEEEDEEDEDDTRNMRETDTSIKGFLPEDIRKTAVIRRKEQDPAEQAGETRVLVRGERRRTSRKAVSRTKEEMPSDETVVLRRETGRKDRISGFEDY